MTVNTLSVLFVRPHRTLQWHMLDVNSSKSMFDNLIVRRWRAFIIMSTQAHKQLQYLSIYSLLEVKFRANKNKKKRKIVATKWRNWAMSTFVGWIFPFLCVCCVIRVQNISFNNSKILCSEKWWFFFPLRILVPCFGHSRPTMKTYADNAKFNDRHNKITLE